MKILISAITYHPTIGGADDYVRSIAEGLAAAGHEVLVAASDLLKHVEGTKLTDTSEKKLNGVRIRRCRSRNLPGHVYPVWPSLYNEIRSFRPDVIHGFGLGYFSTDGAAMAAGNIPVVISPTGGRYRSGKLYNLLRMTALRKTKFVAIWTALSMDEKNVLLQEHNDLPPIRLLPPSVVPEEWITSYEDPFPEIKNQHRILFAGRMARDKGINDLIRAYSEIRSQFKVDLVLVGPDYGFKPPADIPGIHVIGPVDRETLVAAYQHCSFLSLPSYHEGFGIVLLEAMAAEKPVVTYDNSALPELARHQVNGMCVRTGDVAGLSQAMFDILKNPRAAKEMGKNGRKRAFKEFSRTQMISTALACYKEALALS